MRGAKIQTGVAMVIDLDFRMEAEVLVRTTRTQFITTIGSGDDGLPRLTAEYECICEPQPDDRQYNVLGFVSRQSLVF